MIYSDIRNMAKSYVFDLPEWKDGAESGIYFVISGTEIIYVGQSVDIKKRLLQHSMSRRFLGCKFVWKKRDLSFQRLHQEEAFWIMAIRPRENRLVNVRLVGLN